MTKEQRLYCILLMSYLRSREKFLLSQYITSADQFFSLTKKDVEACISRKLSTYLSPRELLKTCEFDFSMMERYRVQCIPYDDDRYPPLLREIYDPPVLLLCRGNVNGLLDYVSIVGTRHASKEGLDAASNFAESAVEDGFGVVSGLAKGIDAAAHRGALESKGVTVAVLGCGVDVVYPKNNKQLFQNIIEHAGGVVSEYPLGTPPLKFHFPERNRIVSGMSKITVLVEAPKQSGAMITARLALEQGRDVLVHRAGVDSEGIQILVDQGAQVVNSMREVYEKHG